VAWDEAYPHTRIDMGRRWWRGAGAVPLWWRGEAGSASNTVVRAEAYHRTKWHLDPCSHLATIDMDRKWGLCPFSWGGGAGSPSNTMSTGPRPTCLPSFVFICPTIWPQYTNITDRTDRQTDNGLIASGRTILQMVAQKRQMAKTRLYLMKHTTCPNVAIRLTLL